MQWELNLYFIQLKMATSYLDQKLKALLAHPQVDAEIDKDGLTELFALGPAVSPGSGLYKNIKEVSPAHYVVITKENIQEKEYWKLIAKDFTESEDDAVEHVRELLTDAIKRQLVGDVPLCTFLSGGLDSSAISAIAAEEYKKKNKQLTTYCIDYEDNDKYFESSLYEPTSDKYWARKMSEISKYRS